MFCPSLPPDPRTDHVGMERVSTRFGQMAIRLRRPTERPSRRRNRPAFPDRGWGRVPPGANDYIAHQLTRIALDQLGEKLPRHGPARRPSTHRELSTTPRRRPGPPSTDGSRRPLSRFTSAIQELDGSSGWPPCGFAGAHGATVGPGAPLAAPLGRTGACPPRPAPGRRRS
jgi:hypothetical protein